MASLASSVSSNAQPITRRERARIDRQIEKRFAQSDVSNVSYAQLVDPIWAPVSGEVGIDAVGVPRMSSADKTPLAQAKQIISSHQTQDALAID